MNENILAELTKLQDELGMLDSAVKQIDKAAQISSEVVNAIKTVETKYAEHLDQILSQYSEYLNSTYKHVEENINVLLTSHKNQLEQLSKNISDLQISINEKQNENNSLVQQSQSKAEQTVGDLSAAMNSQIQDINSVLNSYLELAKSTSLLSDKIENVDFPSRFDKSEIMLGNTYQEIASIKDVMKNMYANYDLQSALIHKQNGRISFLMFMVVFFFILAMGFGIIVKFFPHFLRLI